MPVLQLLLLLVAATVLILHMSHTLRARGWYVVNYLLLLFLVCIALTVRIVDVAVITYFGRYDMLVDSGR